MTDIFLVDDHDLFRTGMQSILEQRDEFTVVGQAPNGEEAIRQLAQMVPDVVMMDVNMPGMGGIEATRRLVRQHPDLRIIAVTSLSEDPFPHQLLDAGAKGYLTKGCPADEMFMAIQKVMTGLHYLSSEIAQKLSLASFVRHGEVSPLSKLSAREMQVMRMVTAGKSTKQISEELHLSAKTVSTYRYRLYEKLEVENDVQLTHFSYRHGLIDQH